MLLSMPGPRVVLIGAGSASFGLAALGGLLRRRAPALRGMRLALVDTAEDGLTCLTAVAERLAPAGITIESAVDRARVLRGADVVVIAVATDREAAWARDRALAARAAGLSHYGENGGPGGLFHTARSQRLIAPILRDVERLAPDATLVHLSNPLPRICRATARLTDLRQVGLCHQIRFGYLVAAVALADELDLEVPRDFAFRWDDASIAAEARLAAAAAERLEIRAAGLNHFTWMLAVTDRRSGEDLLPALRGRLVAGARPRFEPLTRHLAAVTGQVPVSGDTHLSEYLPYTRTAEAWARYEIQPYDHRWSQRVRAARWALARALARGEADPAALDDLSGDGVEDVVAALVGASAALPLPAVNVQNDGRLSDLPHHAVVEVPGVVGQRRIEGDHVGPLPQPIAEWCRREAAVAELAVGAVLDGSRELALQALLLDPTVPGLEEAVALLDAWCEAEPDALTGIDR